MAENSVPIPLNDPIAKLRRRDIRPGDVDPLENTLTDPWVQFMTFQSEQISQSPSRIASVILTNQGASISGTSISGGSVAAGLYRVTWYARITQAASTSSSLTVTITWTDSVVCTFSGAAMTGNTTATVQTGTFLLGTSGAGPITYSTTYASVGATPMKYKLNIILEVITL